MNYLILLAALFYIGYRIRKERAANQYSVTIMFLLGLGVGLGIWLVSIIINNQL